MKVMTVLFCIQKQPMVLMSKPNVKQHFVLDKKEVLSENFS